MNKYRPEVVSERIRQARRNKHLKQKDIARYAFMSRSEVSALEMGHRPLSVKTALLLGELLDVRATWLLDLED